MERQTVVKSSKPATRVSHVQRQSAGPASAIHPLLALQSSLGNQAIQRLINSPYVQAKLQISTPGDPFEQEADRVSDSVMRMPDREPTKQNNTQTILREPAQPAEEEEEKREDSEASIQRVPLAAREDDEEAMVQEKPLPDVVPDEEKKATVQAKANTDTPTQLRVGDEEEDEQAGPTINRLVDHRNSIQRTVFTRASPIFSPTVFRTVSGLSVQRMCATCSEKPQQPALARSKLVTVQTDSKCVGTTCEEQKPIQRAQNDSSAPAVNNNTERLLQSSRSSGRPIPEGERRLFESKFDHDFSKVALHTDSTAHSLSESLNARAFTTGHDIYIRQGEYQPHTSQGRELLAHELTHVIQQESGPVAGTGVGGGMSVSHPNDSFEQAASQTAKTVVQQLHDGKAINLKPTSSTPNSSNRAIQRDDAPPAAQTPEDLISSYTTLNFLDEEGLGKDLAKRLPGDATFVDKVFKKLGSSDQDDVAFEVVKATTPDKIPDWMRINFVGYLVTGVVVDEEEKTISQIWMSFGPALPDTAEKNRDLWKKSLWESEYLVKEERIDTIRKDFHTDVKGLALEYLKENKRTLNDEASRYGIDLEGQASTAPSKPNYLETVRAMIPGIIKIKNFQEELKQIQVGYYTLPDCIAACEKPSRFSPEHEPQIPPTGKETPPLPKYADVKGQYDRASALISAFGKTYPTIYLLIQQDKLNELDKAGDASKAMVVIRETIDKTDGKIKEATEKISSEEINYFDLKMIHAQLFGGKPPVDYGMLHPWEQWFFQDIAQDHIKGHEARQFWISLGLGLLAAIALIAAPFTGGLTAAFLIGFGLGIGAAQAGISWEQYLAKSTVADAKVKEELTVISEGEVTAALIEAIVNTVAVFLDVWGVKTSMTAARATKGALELAEKGLKEELEVAAKRKALREAGKELGVTAAGTAVAIGLHELEEDEPVPEMQAVAPQWQIVVGPEEPETTPSDVNRMVIQRSPGPGDGKGSMSVTAPIKEPILLTGGEFEVYVEKALLRGPMGDLPKMSFVIPGQYTGSGWGIDRIGIVFDESKGVIDVYHLEMKFVAPGSKFVPELGQRAAGTQTGKAWTKNAVDGFLNSQHPTARAGRERLRRALQKMHPGEVIDIGRMRSFLNAKLLDAPIRVVIPHWADFSKLYKQVAALIRAGRDIKLLKLKPPK